jgi:hypothetical protein
MHRTVITYLQIKNILNSNRANNGQMILIMLNNKHVE